MGKSLTEKIIADHLVSGRLQPGTEIGLRIDQTLTQDSTGTLAYLQFEALGVPRVRTELSVSYIDHNLLQTGFQNADDHRYLQSVAARCGLYLSRAGNGICHQVHLERFAVPGQTLLGADSHTPTAGGLGMLAIGSGGLDVAAAMAGGPFYLVMPHLTLVRLLGELPPWVSAKDVILELLRRLSVKGGRGRVFEYAGPGVAALSAPERATITNMGAELGATTSLFPSDEHTRQFLRAQDREQAYRPLAADPDANYDQVLELDLASLEPLVACPHMPDQVRPVAEVAGTPLAQVAIGSCTNSSYRDLMTAAAILRTGTVHPQTSLVISPGSRQVLLALARSGALADLVGAGARILECACGPCLGMGQSPPTGSSSLRTFNRNFRGRSGTADANVYLASPEVAAASALAGEIRDPRTLGEPPRITLPERFAVDDRMIIPPLPEAEAAKVEISRGPNIKPVPRGQPLPEDLEGEVLAALGDNITTDDIMPAGADLLPLRSNVPALALHVLERVRPGFAARAQQRGGGFLAGGANYGQGSSREHAALCPRYLGVRAVLAQSFARIHHDNLVNFGLLPVVVPAGDLVGEGDQLRLPGVRTRLLQNQPLLVENLTRGTQFEASHHLTARQVQVLVAGGLLNHLAQR